MFWCNCEPDIGTPASFLDEHILDIDISNARLNFVLKSPLHSIRTILGHFSYHNLEAVTEDLRQGCVFVAVVVWVRGVKS